MTIPLHPMRACDLAIVGDSLIEEMRLDTDANEIVLVGVSGSTVRDWLRLAPGMLGRLRPKTVIIALGINDVSGWDEDGDEFAHRYERLCGLFKDAGARVFVSTILPVERGKIWGDAMDTSLIALFNEAIAGIAKKWGYGLIDSHKALAGPDGMMLPGLTTDGVHLSGEGYRRWKPVLLQGAGVAPESL